MKKLCEAAVDNGEMIRLKRENTILKSTVATLRNRNAPTASSFRCGTLQKSKLFHVEARKKVISMFPSMPVDLMPETISHVSDTQYSGTFGTISVVRYSWRSSCKKGNFDETLK
jgi:hypothetical protein